MFHNMTKKLSRLPEFVEFVSTNDQSFHLFVQPVGCFFQMQQMTSRFLKKIKVTTT